jgi:hypothetical protein
MQSAKILLRQKNLKINAQDNSGSTALHYATLSQNIEMVILLLDQKNTNVQIKDKDGFSAVELLVVEASKDDPSSFPDISKTILLIFQRHYQLKNFDLPESVLFFTKRIQFSDHFGENIGVLNSPVNLKDVPASLAPKEEEEEEKEQEPQVVEETEMKLSDDEIKHNNDEPAQELKRNEAEKEEEKKPAESSEPVGSPETQEMVVTRRPFQNIPSDNDSEVRKQLFPSSSSSSLKQSSLSSSSKKVRMNVTDNSQQLSPPPPLSIPAPLLPRTVYDSLRVQQQQNATHYPITRIESTNSGDNWSPKRVKVNQKQSEGGGETSMKTAPSHFPLTRFNTSPNKMPQLSPSSPFALLTDEEKDSQEQQLRENNNNSLKKKKRQFIIRGLKTPSRDEKDEKEKSESESDVNNNANTSGNESDSKKPISQKRKLGRAQTLSALTIFPTKSMDEILKENEESTNPEILKNKSLQLSSSASPQKEKTDRPLSPKERKLAGSAKKGSFPRHLIPEAIIEGEDSVAGPGGGEGGGNKKGQGYRPGDSFNEENNNYNHNNNSHNNSGLPSVAGSTAPFMTTTTTSTPNKPRMNSKELTAASLSPAAAVASGGFGPGMIIPILNNNNNSLLPPSTQVESSFPSADILPFLPSPPPQLSSSSADNQHSNNSSSSELTRYLPDHLDVIICVEHCMDCHLHNNQSLRHDVQKYVQTANAVLFSLIKAMIGSKLAIRLYAMRSKPLNLARLGAFEVTIAVRMNLPDIVYDIPTLIPLKQDPKKGSEKDIPPSSARKDFDPYDNSNSSSSSAVPVPFLNSGMGRQSSVLRPAFSKEGSRADGINNEGNIIFQRHRGQSKWVTHRLFSKLETKRYFFSSSSLC